MIKLLDWLITRLEKHTKDSAKRKTYRNILGSIDEYLNKVKEIVTIRYYSYFSFGVDDVEKAIEDSYTLKKLDEHFDIFFGEELQ